MEITSEQVKLLRDRTGAGMMDCKKALTESGGNMEKAVEYLRKKGAATAEKRADRTTNQGVVEAYIHAGGRIGAMVELNCETDFVAKTDDFKLLARDIAMQIAAMNPHYTAREDVPKEIEEKELDIYRTQARNEKKPELVVDRIATGRLEKFFQDVCLLEQTFIKDSGKTIKDIILDTTSKTGEKITIRRFERFHLGENHA
ncbi:MAG: translation elongation factor Ts [Ignavibacteriae bacterium]|nr:translation elongation factor Ts [Ignavibacteria bacterium]MBI3364260.1 translation elongation factor Ts [Ignavibacteriota bacterium]